MSVQQATVGNTVTEETVKDQSESELNKKPLPLTEDEEAFKGPKFYPPVYRRRYAAVCELAKKHQAKKVLDFGCAEAKLVKILTNQGTLPQLEEVVGIDINKDLLEENKFRINPLIADYLRPRTHPFKVSLYQGSIAEADERFIDFDLIACVELIEHLEPDILNAMPEVVFGQLSPKVVIVTTPNVEFNVLFPDLKGFRHYDHKFEWTRAEFEEWSNSQASKYNYTVTFDGIAPGPEGTEHLGCCSQVAVFLRVSSSVTPTKESGICQPYNLIAEAEYPFRIDTRTEEEKILLEVEYVLWLLSSMSEEESDNCDETDDEPTPNNSDDAPAREEGFSDGTKRVEDDEGCVYSLEKLLSFQSLFKLCGDIQKLKGVLQDSSKFHLTEDGCGVLWHKPSQQWSSDESDTGWDACADDQGVDESNRFQDSEWKEPENWDDDSDNDVCTNSGAHDLNAATQSEVCWDWSNDRCKFWNGKDWGEIEDGGSQEEVEEYSANLHNRDNVMVVQQSDGSLSNDSDDNDIDGLFWISDSSKVPGEDMA